MLYVKSLKIVVHKISLILNLHSFASICLLSLNFLSRLLSLVCIKLKQSKSVWTKVTDNGMIQNKESEAYFLYLGARMTSLAPLETEICYHRNFFLVQTFLTDYESFLTTKCCNGNFLQISSKSYQQNFLVHDGNIELLLKLKSSIEIGRIIAASAELQETPQN